MKFLGLFVFAGVAAAASAHAQSIEASRYMNRQGIEVIQARPLPSSREDNPIATQREPVSEQIPLTKPTARGRVQTAQVAPDPRLQVSAREQGARDKDRLAILNQELFKEMSEYENKSKILRSPSMRNKLTDDELARLREVATDHEKNIQALSSEISGMRK